MENMVFTDDELSIIETMVEERVAVVEAAADAHWILHSAVLVFLMQAGFAMLCAGRGHAAPTSPREREIP